MGTLEGIVASTILLAGNPDGGPGSNPEGVRVNAFDMNKVSECSPVSVVSKRVVEAETVVEMETTLDDDSELGRGGKEKNVVENLSSLSYGGAGLDVSVIGNDFASSVNSISDGANGMCGDYKQANGGLCLDGDEQSKAELVDPDNGFLVGDFVWGKIRSHPWWPGQVYDPRDASEFAMKHGQEGRLLVAFFGDGSCSWCLPSQLTPFVPNFKKMSKDSSSNSFRYAVQKALDEVGRIMELEMTCKCIEEELKVSLYRPLVANIGVRVGVHMPEVSVKRLSIMRYGPKTLLAKLRCFAKDVSGGNGMECVTLKSWLSAYYRFKDGFTLTQYHEPCNIEGLEYMDNNVGVVTNDFSVPIGDPIVGAQDNDGLNSPPAGAVRLGAYLDDRIYHRRKQKSVTELMEEKADFKLKSRKRDKLGERTEFGKTGKSGSDRKRKASNGVEECGSHKASTVENIDVPVEDITSVEESEVETTPRERKRSKYLSPPFIDLNSMTSSTFKIHSEIGPDNVAKVAQGKEQMTEAVKEHFASLFVDEAHEEEMNDGELKGHDNEVETDGTTVTISDVNVPVDVLLSEIQFAAIDPLYLSKKGSLDMVWDFVSALRSSIYIEGSNYKKHSKSKTCKKREFLNDTTKKKRKALDLKSCKSVTTKTGGKLGDFKSKEVVETPVRKISPQKGEKTSSARLYLTFTPDFPLPSKSDILQLFGKFGSLNEKETNVVPDSHSVEIVYQKDSDAETAFMSSVIQSPFGSKNVNYRLQHSPPLSELSESQSKVSSPLEGTAKKQVPADELMYYLDVIKQKFEIMSATLENHCSKLSLEEKLSFKDEMKHLMERFDAATEKVRIMAEKTSP
ncbi:hypothetical protein F511_22492 [Dorcoceras hygrometricum]|uniref:PWWP domain-containing protein n=1 Tax=Dorcoceras hygrometricum TaxID=472368 RepID=A0A2Z7AX92_9LAMI|nr:hypothetical protein F511_22492 [Dorcoceras hygrometricum]